MYRNRYSQKYKGIERKKIIRKVTSEYHYIENLKLLLKETKVALNLIICIMKR